MASGDDYYKEYKRRLREDKRAKRKKAPIIAFIAIVAISCGVTIYFLSENNKGNGNNELKSNITVSSDVIDANSHEQQNKVDNSDKTKSATEKQPPKNTNSVYDGNSKSNTETENNTQKQPDDEYDADRQKLLDEIAKNEKEKQRLAEEQAATQLESKCNSIKNNYSTAIKNEQTSYNQKVQEISASCSSFGGCPALGTAKTNHDNNVKSIQSSYGQQWNSTGCSGNLY